MPRKMIVNATEGDECRIAILEDGALQDLFMERNSQSQIVGNIHKGKVVNVEPGIEAAFIDFGYERNGFLHASDVMASYADKGKQPHHGKGHKIQSLLRRGQEATVQVTKAGIGNKGPSLTTYLSLPGRYLVLMPDVNKRGVSKRITSEEERQKLKTIVDELKIPENMGVIVRTAGVYQTKKELAKDLDYLLNLWRVIEGRAKSQPAPSLLYQESDLIIRAIRDMLTPDINEIIADSPVVRDRVQDFLRAIMPKNQPTVALHTEADPLFHKFKVEEEIEKASMRKVPLPSGGSIVIDQTEAMVAIDVNSGRMKTEKDAEATALKTNLEAVKEIARQLRIRDMGGVIVNDFIDMRDHKNIRAVEKALADELKKDKARTKMARMSAFGIIEMTRQRMRPSLRRFLYDDCPHCSGMGIVKNPESMSLTVTRELKKVTGRGDVATIEVLVNPTAADYLLNHKRRDVAQLEESANKRILIRGSQDVARDKVEIRCFRKDGQKVSVA